MPDILLCFKKRTKDPHKGSQESSGFQIPPKTDYPPKKRGLKFPSNLLNSGYSALYSRLFFWDNARFAKPVCISLVF